MKNTCNYFNLRKCQSCTHLNDNVSDYIAHKVEDLKKEIGDLSEVEVRPPVFLQNPFKSRNKVRLVVSGSVSQPLLGIPAPDDRWQTNELLECPLHIDGINEVLPSIKEIIIKYTLTPYDIHKRTGELKYFIAYKSESTGEMYYRFVLRSKEALDRLKKAVTEMTALNPSLKVVSCNIQPKPMASHEGEEEIFLTENHFVLNKMNDLWLPVSTQSFFQVTSQIAQKLYAEVQQHITEEERVLDLFCGVGGFAFHVASKSKSVVGVELSSIAIECANYANELNNTKNTQFVAEDAFTYLRNQKGEYSTIVVNPPRRGLGEDVVRLIQDLNPERIFYSSCNPKTFLSDRNLLKGYKLKWIRPFDMFPYSSHLEVLGEFEKIS